jgi:hypothetical protein
MAHNSTLKKGEPAWGKVNKETLPDSAFADTKGRRFPHHWVSGGKMYLHRGGLASALQHAGGARSGKEASSAIKAHLNVHAKAIGMKDKKKQSQNIPVDINALHIMDQENPEFEFSESAEGVRKFRMVGYSGKIITGHWWWGNLGIDLDGISFKKPKFPILRDHLTSKEMGFSKKPQISNKEGLVFTEKEVTFLENEDVDKFVENSRKGFPTTAQVFSSSGHTVDIEVENIGSDHDQITDKLEVFSMDLDKLREDSPEEYERLMAEAIEATKATTADAIAGALDESASKFQALLDEKDNQIVTLTTEKTDLSESFTKIEGRCLSLEKKDALRDEADLKSQEESVWLTALAASSLPSWQHEKVRKQVTRDKFMTGDVFDKAAFTEAVVAEITDWETQSGLEVEGFGIILRESDGSSGATDQMKSDAIVNRMLGYVGQASKGVH